MDATVATGTAAMMAIRLLDQDVPQDNISLAGVCDTTFFTSRLRPRPGRLSLKIETETETFGCWSQKLRLRLLVVGIKS